MKFGRRVERLLKLPETWLLMITLMGSLVRLLWLGDHPMGLHQDEAYSAYNSWAILNYGIDSFGYVRPVYYTVWGSGMSVLYSYLTMPFFAIWGVSVETIRIPQAIMGIVSIPVIYGLGKEMFQSKWMGVFFAFLLSINPWNIQQSRFGLDCNLAVPMLLLAMYFLCGYLNGRTKFLWGAAVFFGLTLYSYALTWLVVPLILVLSFLFFHKRISFTKDFFLPMLLLFIMAFPLFLFLAVNYDLLPEIKTSLFSIPKLPALRTEEIQFNTSVFKQRFLSLIFLLLFQNDGRWWISNNIVGTFYYISIPFAVLGALYYIKIFMEWLLKKRQFPIHFLVALWFGVGFLVGCSVDMVLFHKINYLQIPIILLSGVGIWRVGNFLRKIKLTVAVTIGVYAVCFIYYIYAQVTFPVDYETYGYPDISHMNWYQYEEALELAQELTDGEISIIALNHVNVMLWAKIPPQQYMDTVVMRGDAEFLEIVAFDRYLMEVRPSGDITKDETVYVYPHSINDYFAGMGYTTVHADECYDVAYRAEVYGNN
ncbi:MAG: glycosyltransferase family 39 protein [Acetatifactor sp.]|nr:glycosyltransferase family 39 protein [Acetatifactor sp.]